MFTPDIDMTKSVADAWETYYASQGIKFGKVVFAQYTWETNFGHSKIFRENHNGYGMKYRREKDRTKQISLGIKNGHAYYKNHADSVRDYARWQKRLLAERPDVTTDSMYLDMLDRYKVSWCYNCRYAEDENYTEKIKARMKELSELKN